MKPLVFGKNHAVTLMLLKAEQEEQARQSAPSFLRYIAALWGRMFARPLHH